MTAEQHMVVENFRKNFKEKNNIIIYGTGINGLAVIESCKDLDIIGVMDSQKEGCCFGHLKVMTLEEVANSGSKCIVIVARPAVHQIIYRRISSFVNQHEITVYDVNGNEIKESKVIRDDPYFEKKYNDLLSKIDNYDVISFDIFDTLVMRPLYSPEDIFSLLDLQIEGESDLTKNIPQNFYQDIRKNVAIDLKDENPTYTRIYDEIATRYSLSNDTKTYLKNKEYELERRLLKPRKVMVEALNYAYKKGKKVILVSDMYYTKGEIEVFLDDLNICGYDKLYVSCEIGMTKETGVFNLVKNDYDSFRILHIGDNIEADCHSPEAFGIDSYHILSAIKMLELSTHKGVLSYIDNIYSKVIIGFMADMLFNNPFALYNSKGKVELSDEETFARCYLSPVFLMFTMWLIHKLKGSDAIFFSARDGYFIQKIYRKIIVKYNIKNMPKDIYLLISRLAALEAKDGMEVESNEYIGFKNYLNSIKLYTDKDNIYMFDFMSKGTCQCALEKLLNKKINGIYFQKSAGVAAENLDINNDDRCVSFYKEKSAMEADRYVFAMCDFLECILTSDMPSLEGFDLQGKPKYFDEVRDLAQIEFVMKMQDYMMDYVCEYTDIVPRLDDDILSDYKDSIVNLCDEILRCTDINNLTVNIDGLKTLTLDVDLNHVKNIGYDLFVGGDRGDT